MHEGNSRRPRLASAVAVSCAYHLAAIAVVVIAIRLEPRLARDPRPAAERVHASLVFQETGGPRVAAAVAATG